jgi:hypothetical protein
MGKNSPVYGWAYVLKIKGRVKRTSRIYPDEKQAWEAGIQEWRYFHKMELKCYVTVELKNGPPAMARELY